MLAVRYHEPGDASTLQIDDIDKPTPGHDEILVDVRAASINPTDVKRRMRGEGPFPKTTGSDFAGVVEAVGQDVTDFSQGDTVCGTGLHTARFQQGSFAEYVAVPTDIVTALPPTISFEEGAAVALVGVTAWLGLIDHGELKPSDACLIHGGTGGVGHIAVQLSNLLCAHTVTTAHPDRKEAAYSFGADSVVSYLRDDLLDAVSEITDGGYDVILDHRAQDYFSFDIAAAAFDGSIVHYGGTNGEVEYSTTTIKNDLSIQAFTMSNLPTAPEKPRIASVLSRVIDLVQQGVLAPSIGRTYRLEEAQEFHRAILEDSVIGKIVVIP